jgi:hypothetical protein
MAKAAVVKRQTSNYKEIRELMPALYLYVFHIPILVEYSY